MMKERDSGVEKVISAPLEKGALGFQIINDPKSVEEDGLSIKELILTLRKWWKYIFSKWLIIIATGILGGIFGLYYAYNQKPIYKAELKFALEDDSKSGGGLGGALGLASQFGIDLGGGGGGAFSGDNLLELMKSRSMIRKALLTEIDFKGKKETLAEFYIDFKHLRDKWKPELKTVRFLNTDDPRNFTRTQDSLLGVFHKQIIASNLSVDKVEKLSIIAVNVKSENELFSKNFAEVLTKEVADFYVETKTKKSVENLAILQHQTDSVRRALNGAITGVAATFDANPNPNPSRQILQVPSQRKRIDVEANEAILTELVKNLEISKISLRKEIPLIQVIDVPTLPLEVEKFGIIKGILLGGVFGALLTVIFLVVRRAIKQIMI